MRPWKSDGPTEGVAVYKSQSFSATNRGPDGKHYFLLYDKTQESAFVWFKDNF